MRSLQPAALLIILVASLLTVGDAASDSKIKPKSVRAALERRYAELRNAYSTRDSSGALASRRPDSFTITRAGDTVRLWRVDHIRPGVWLVDGKRIDPSRPYDPDAPEYRPH